MTSSLNDANHPGTLISKLHYGPFGLVNGILGNGVTESYGYSARGQGQSFFSTPYAFSLGLVPDSNIASSSDTLAQLKLSASMLTESGLSGFDQAQITDGDISTNGWHTDSATPGAWLQVDLGSGNAQAVTEVRIYPAYAGYAGNYTVQYSDDDSNWSSASSGFVPSQAGWNSQSWTGVGAHRYWRLYLTNTPGSGPWLNELQLVAPTAGVNGNWSYTYDVLGRTNAANQTGGTSLNFDVDRNSNRWHQNPNGAQLGFDISSNQIASGNGVTYDALGNIMNDGQHNYTYDAEGRLSQVDGGSTATYIYNALGERSRRTFGSANYDDVYDLNGNMITEVYSTGWGPGEVYLGARHLANYSAGTTYFPLSDWLGSERVRTDVNGNTAGTCTGNPYGDNYVCAGTDPSRIKYAGMEYDSETQLYHTKYRYYNSRLAVWLNPDPAGISAANSHNPQSLNRYTYVLSNPVNATDHRGLLVDEFDFSDPWGGFSGPSGLLGFNGMSPCPNNACSGNVWVDDPEGGHWQVEEFHAFADGGGYYSLAGPGALFYSADQAGKAATQSYEGKTQKDRRERAGAIYRDQNGIFSFNYTAIADPCPENAQMCAYNVHVAAPAGTTRVGDWHDHPFERDAIQFDVDRNTDTNPRTRLPAYVGYSIGGDYGTMRINRGVPPAAARMTLNGGLIYLLPICRLSGPTMSDISLCQ
jgi:RHS repeat-associated protein